MWTDHSDLNGSATVEVISIDGQSVVDQATGERYYRVDIGAQVPLSKTSPSTMNVFPQSNVSRLRFYLHIVIPFSEWRGQYQVGQRYELVIQEKGELSLKPT